MAIVYDRLFALFEERHINSYTLKKNKILGQATYQSIKKGIGGLDHRSIDNLCRFLNCQPSDIMEYIPDQFITSSQEEKDLSGTDD